MTRHAIPRSAAALAAALTLAACAGEAPREDAPPAAGTAPPAAGTGQPSAAPPAAETGRPDSRGVVVYRDYAAVVARSGDTVEAMAARAGVAPSALAAYNGLPTGYQPRPGDELVLPPREGGYRAAAPAPAQSAQAPAPDAPTPLSEAPAAAQPAGAPPAQTPAAAADGAGGWDPARIGEAITRAPSGQESAAADSARPEPPAPSFADGYREVAYHEVGPEETVYSIARSYGVPAQTLIAWNALSGPAYSVTPGQVLVIPGGGAAPAETAPEGVTPPGEGGEATPPPSAGRPLPPDTAPARPLASPELGRYQTPPEAGAPAEGEAEATPPPAEAAQPPAAGQAPTETAAARPAAAGAPSSAPAAGGEGRLLRPVLGEIVRPYSRQPGAARNDGVDFAAEVGAPVRAAADGTVALVSTSLGEWGNIVLVRHDDRLMTVYGRMGTVAVAKGESVRAGDVLGDVAASDEGRPTLHFEVRRGAFSENPADHF